MTFPKQVDVAVIGAGVAGLTAATALAERGRTCLVLEAADYVGGRCVTDMQTFRTPFDRGASWLHSAGINPLAKIAQTRSATIHKTQWDWTHIHAKGRNLGPSEVAEFVAYKDQMWQAISDAGSGDGDCTIQSAMPQSPYAALSWHSISQMNAGDPDVTSAKDTFNYALANGDWLIEGGLGSFIRSLNPAVEVALNCKVNLVDLKGKDIRLETSRGTLLASRVITTVSTGVLAAETIQFDPPLPIQKLNAIEQLPNGLLNKIGIEFATGWGGAGLGQTADYHSGDKEACTILFGFYDSSLAVGFVSGQFAKNLEAAGAGAASAYCTEALGAIFGSSISRQIDRIDETAWQSDTNQLGSYSYAKPGGTASRDVLAQSVDGRLFFAGEATQKHSFATVHGAYESGLRVASEIEMSYQ